MLVEDPGERSSSKQPLESVRLVPELEDNSILEEANSSNKEVGDLLSTEVLATIRLAPANPATQDPPSQS